MACSTHGITELTACSPFIPREMPEGVLGALPKEFAVVQKEAQNSNTCWGLRVLSWAQSIQIPPANCLDPLKGQWGNPTGCKVQPVPQAHEIP